MKRIFYIAILTLAFFLPEQANAQRFPFGNATTIEVEDAATLNFSITNSMTLITVDQLAADATVNLTVAKGVPIGSQLFIRLQSDGTARDVSPGTNFEGTDMAGTINKTKMFQAVYDGTNFVIVGERLLD